MPQIWTAEEEINFFKGIAKKESMDQLSKKHDRTPSALELRLKKIIYDNIQSGGATENSLSKLLNMDVDKIRQYNYEYKGFIEKKDSIGVSNNQTQSISLNKNNTSVQSKLIVEPPTKMKNIEVHNGGSKDKKNTSNFVDEGTTQQKFISKIKQLKRENKIMREIVDNSELRKKINKMIREGKLDKKYKKVIKKLTGKE